MYDDLSQYTHANPHTLDIKYNNVMMKDVIRMLSTLCLFNTLSYSQLYWHFGKPILDMVKDKTSMFLNEMLLTQPWLPWIFSAADRTYMPIGGTRHRMDYQIARLFPDRPELAERLIWCPPELSDKSRA